MTSPDQERLSVENRALIERVETPSMTIRHISPANGLGVAGMDLWDLNRLLNAARDEGRQAERDLIAEVNEALR